MLHSLRPVFALLLSTALLLTGNGLQQTLVPIRADLEAFDQIALGALGSSYYVGFLLGCFAGPYLILRAGHIRAFLATVSAASAVALAHAIIIDELPWYLFRATTGFCLAAIFLTIESWLNERATNENRGFVMSAYVTLVFAFLVVGQMMVTIADPRTFTLFALASILVSFAAIPVAMTRSEQPAPVTIVRFSPKALFHASPVGFAGVFISGFTNGAFWSLGAVFATRIGYSVAEAATFMSVVVVGGALMQWPVGRLSDRVDRRKVLIGILVMAALAGALLGFLRPPTVVLLGLAFMFGMFTLPVYTVAASHAFDMANELSVVDTSAGLLLVNATGSIFGPVAAAFFMDYLGSGGLFVAIAASQALLIAYVAYRMQQRMAPVEKTDYEFAASAPIGGVITPEPLEEDDPHVVVPEIADAPSEYDYFLDAVESDHLTEDKASNDRTSDEVSHRNDAR
ncbi:MAG: MFS transporter [Hyphomicrobiales bacterium]|nr:MFS transporter [Hyphomicrobiales bacterium]